MPSGWAMLEVLRSTWAGLAAPRRLVPILLVALPMLWAQVWFTPGMAPLALGAVPASQPYLSAGPAPDIRHPGCERDFILARFPWGRSVRSNPPVSPQAHSLRLVSTGRGAEQ